LWGRLTTRPTTESMVGGTLSGLLLGHSVVLFAVDLVAEPVLLPVDLLLFVVGQIAAVGLAVGTDFLVQRGFLVLRSVPPEVSEPPFTPCAMRCC
jgi:anaerobic C4-dicarboxylate transporter